jgi:hypothetical protein
MISPDKLPYTMIKAFENERRFALDDSSFDAFEYLSQKLQHKNSSTLRKIAGPHSSRCGAKLGVEDAIILMTEMNDYRLIEYIREDCIRRKKEHQQLNLFSQPLRTL